MSAVGSGLADYVEPMAEAEAVRRAAALDSPAEIEGSVRAFIRAWHVAQLRRGLRWCLRLLPALLLMVAPPGRAEPPPTRLLSDGAGGIGLLTLPASMSLPGPLPPAVILVHDATGLDERSRRTGTALLDAGIAVLEFETVAIPMDGFGVPPDADPDAEVAAITRARAALDAAGMTDPGRVAGLGFGRGAQTLALLPGRGQGGPAWAAQVLLYPGCASLSALLAEAPPLAGSPLLLLHGDADPGNRPDDCRDLASQLGQGEARVRVIAYPGATYGWDMPPIGVDGVSFQPDPSGVGRLTVQPWPELAQMSAAQAAAFLWTALRAAP